MKTHLFLLLLIPLVCGDIHEEFNNKETFDLEGITYEIRYIPDQDIDLLQIVSKFGKIVLSEDECEQYGQYNFCFERWVPKLEDMDTEIPELLRDKVEIKVTKTCDEDCIGIAAHCRFDEDCDMPFCVHGICASARHICGDGYCDNDEECVADCSYTVKNASHFVIPSNLDWIEIPVENGNYSVIVKGTYEMDENHRAVSAEGIDEPGYPREELPKGALIAKLCGSYMVVNSTLEINNCNLQMRVNEKRLFDNKGNFTVELKGSDSSGNNTGVSDTGSVGASENNSKEGEIQNPENNPENNLKEDARDSPEDASLNDQNHESQGQNLVDPLSQYYLEIIFLVIILTGFIAFIVYMIKRLF
ncbi:MAG: hypothetical protein R6V53_04830 [Candidatus Woesearchaeota archaeon]